VALGAQEVVRDDREEHRGHRACGARDQHSAKGPERRGRRREECRDEEEIDPDDRVAAELDPEIQLREIEHVRADREVVELLPDGRAQP
jgi:hypothetical protein